MTKDDPFGFDLSAASDKKKRTKGRRGMSGAFETAGRRCDHKGCDKPGTFRAPKSPKHLDEYFWFCKDHVREYNLRWNYFQGQSDEEFQKFLDSATVWERPTRPFGRAAEDARLGTAGTVHDAHGLMGDPSPRPTGANRKLPPTERRALEILDARDSMTRAEIRKQYKSLVKDLHPDMNGGNRDDEDRLQEVVWAWDQIKDSRNFKD